MRNLKFEIADLRLQIEDCGEELSTGERPTAALAGSGRTTYGHHTIKLCADNFPACRLAAPRREALARTNAPLVPKPARSEIVTPLLFRFDYGIEVDGAIHSKEGPFAARYPPRPRLRVIRNQSAIP
jgi:hypothetical protein